MLPPELVDELMNNIDTKYLYQIKQVLQCDYFTELKPNIVTELSG